ncbi:MerR family transcriptional regulator [Paenibacillus sp. P26]|nr:MerR family transcriptional regulator [Paenibacillus sp. P26]UUZ96318.1 MerR family transcriptional regulator [Paenibacillus sp. P25]
MKTTFNIQQVTEITGLSSHTLRYYEKAGLIRAIERDDNGYRLYSETDLEWLRFLIRLRDTGMPIRKMQHFAELRYRGEETVAERRRMLEEHKQEIKEQIAQLTVTLEVLNEKTDHYREMEQEIEKRTRTKPV